MPAARLTKPVNVSRYDVIGSDAAVASDFVEHVGLLGQESGAVHPGAPIPVIHMGPPLERSQMNAHTHGQAELNADEMRQIGLYAAEMSLEMESRKVPRWKQYVVHPHVVEGLRNTRFSCVGFVIEAYREAGIDLINTNNESFPEIDFDLLVKAYPEIKNARESLKAAVGIEGNGPWPVVLAGYVMHSLLRDGDAIRSGPYCPRAGDEIFS